MNLISRIWTLARVRPLPEADLPEVAETVAIIMDGNGRWARRRGLPTAAGHRAGTRALRRTVEPGIAHERRAARLELHALAARVRGARFRRPPVAGLRRSRSAPCARRIRAAPATVRRPVTNAVSRLLVAVAALPIVLGAVYVGGWWLFA